MQKVRYAVAKTQEIEPDTGKVVPLGDKGGECALFLHQGVYHAVGNLCPHQNAPLHNAEAYRGQVICYRHGYCFDLKSGDCTNVGGYGLPVYEVTVEADTLYVSVWEDTH